MRMCMSKRTLIWTVAAGLILLLGIWRVSAALGQQSQGGNQPIVSQSVQFTDTFVEPQTLQAAPPVSVEKPLFALVPACFDGIADYSYFSEHLAIQIAKRQTPSFTYFVCDIQATGADALQTALSQETVNGSLEHVSDIAARHDAVLAINADDYGVHKYGVILRGGELIRAKGTTRHMLTLDAQGNLSVITDRKGEDPKARADTLLLSGIRETWEFGPELMRNGQAIPLDSKFDLITLRDTALEPRTAIGQIDSLHYVIIVVDGRSPGYSDGVSLSGLQQLFVQAGARTAFNLDGGGSSTLYFCGEVLNTPSSGHERSVSDILYFR